MCLEISIELIFGVEPFIVALVFEERNEDFLVEEFVIEIA